MLAGDYVKRCSAEFVGTFALVFVAAGSLAFARTLTDIALAYGLVVAGLCAYASHLARARSRLAREVRERAEPNRG